MKAILKINDKEIEVEVTEEQIKQLTEKKSPFERAKEKEEYYFIAGNGKVDSYAENRDEYDNALHEVANYCTDKDLMQQQAWRETLNRLLWRWQHKNDEPVDWDDFRKAKYGFYLDKETNEFITASTYGCKVQTIHFTTEEKAQQAIEEVAKPFMAEHPDFVW